MADEPQVQRYQTIANSLELLGHISNGFNTNVFYVICQVLPSHECGGEEVHARARVRELCLDGGADVLF